MKKEHSRVTLKSKRNEDFMTLLTELSTDAYMSLVAIGKHGTEAEREAVKKDIAKTLAMAHLRILGRIKAENDREKEEIAVPVGGFAAGFRP